MTMANLKLNKYQLTPTLDAQGNRWVQRCAYCDKVVDYKRDHKESYIRLEKLVRHRKCVPPPLR